MEIIKEKKDDLNALLKVKIEAKDYQSEYDKVLKQYSKQVTLPGFRAGKVPVGVVRKRFGKGLLAEEVQKILDKSIDAYIKENELQVLGQPLPMRDMEQGDWDNPSDFEFGFELGLAPDFKLDLSDKYKMNYYKVKVDDTMLNEEVDRMRKRYGKVSEGDKIQEDSLAIGEFVELRKDGLEKEEGIRNKTTIGLEYVKDRKTKKALLGQKVGDTLDIDPKKISDDTQELMRTLGIDMETAKDFGKRYFRFDVQEVKQLEPANMDEEFFAKVLPPDAEQSEQGLRDFMKDSLHQQFAKDSEMMFKRDANNYLVDKLKLKLPDGFLKKYIQMTAENPPTEEQLEKDYSDYANGIKWQLVKNAIIKEQDIKVEFPEVMDHVKGLLANNYQQYGMPLPEDEELTQTAQRVLTENQEEMQRIFDELYDAKVAEAMKSTMKLSEKEVSFDKFKTLAEKV